MTGDQNVLAVDPANSVDQPLFAVSPTLPESVSYDIKPVWTALDLPSSAFPARLGGFADPSQSPYSKRNGAFDTAARGFGATSDRIWFFRGSDYVQYFEHPERKDETTGWRAVKDNWPGVGAPFTTRISAVLAGNIPPYQDHVWLFSGSQYLRYDPNADTVVIAAQPIAGNWRLPDDFALGFDMAIHGVGDYLGVAWFFKGSQYLRYDIGTDTVSYGPADITAMWGNWPASFADGVDFAFYGTGPHAQHIYFFRGDQFIRYSLSADRVDEGPSPAIDAWPALGSLLPVPQLFLLENYKLSTFHGQMGRGDTIGVPTQVPGRGSTEFYVVTKNSQKVDQSTSTNILESSSNQVVENFSDSVRNDSSNSETHDNYDYGADASFHGEVHATGLTGGEANADLKVRGNTQDVRTSFAKPVASQVDNAKQDSHELHSQQVSVKESISQVDVNTETGFKQVVDNTGSDTAINFVLYQLTQEYIIVLSLVDAHVAFRNGDDRAAASSSVRDMGGLLAECVEDPTVREAAQRAVVVALSSVTDATTQQTRSLLVAGAAPADAAVDPGVRTAFTAKDTAGNKVREIDVEGIVVSVERPVVVTGNTALATLHGSGWPASGGSQC